MELYMLYFVQHFTGILRVQLLRVHLRFNVQ